MWIFVTALSIVAKTWKQLKCLLVDEWINTWVNLYNGLFFRNIKKSAIKPPKDMEKPQEKRTPKGKKPT